MRTIGITKTIRYTELQGVRGCLSIEVNGRTVGTFRIACYIVGVCCSGVSVKQGSTVLNVIQKLTNFVVLENTTVKINTIAWFIEVVLNLLDSAVIELKKT